MVDYRSAKVKENASIRDAILAIDRSALQIGLVVDEADKLVGVVTDGDVRRGILKGVEMSQPVSTIMNRKPTIADKSASRAKLVGLMTRKGLRHIPLVDEAGKLVGIELLDPLPAVEKRDNLVVIMAGGFGRRLGELTAETPKPMLAVKNKPLLEAIIENLVGAGFQDVYLSVNYKRNVIQDFFGDGSKHQIRIRYLEEDKPLGTVGSLSLLTERPKKPFLVMNADLVTSVSFASLLDFHARMGAQATMCIRDYDIQVPYGVVKLEDNRVLGLEEKPKLRYFVNAGIYVLEPDCLDLIPSDTYMDMTELLEKLIKGGKRPAAFPIRENWVDIGRVEDLAKVNRD